MIIRKDGIENDLKQDIRLTNIFLKYERLCFLMLVYDD